MTSQGPMISHHRTPIAPPPITFQGTAVPEVARLLLLEYSSTGSSLSERTLAALPSVGTSGSASSGRPTESWTPAAALLCTTALSAQCWSTPCSLGWALHPRPWLPFPPSSAEPSRSSETEPICQAWGFVEPLALCASSTSSTTTMDQILWQPCSPHRHRPSSTAEPANARKSWLGMHSTWNAHFLDSLGATSWDPSQMLL